MKILTTLLALGLLVGGARAQFDATEHLPLGVFNKWMLVQEDDETDNTFVKVIGVKLVDGVLRYTVQTPFFDTLDKVKLVMGVTDDGDWLLYRLGITTDQVDELEAKLMTFDPPVKLGDTSTAFGQAFVTAVDTEVELKLEAGPLKKKIDVLVTGDISSSFEQLFTEQVTPAGTFPANELVGWHFDLDLNFLSDDDDIDFDEDVDVFGFMKLHQGTGIVYATDPNSSEHVLEAAILPGTTVGGDFDPSGTILTGVAAETPGLFLLGGQAAGETTGGEFQLTGVELVQELNGNLTLTGSLAGPGFAGGVPIELEGKSKVNAVTGAGKLKLKGKTKALTEKPLVLKANAVITAETTSIDIAYKSGPEIAGVMNLGLDPIEIVDVEAGFGPLIDTKFEVKKARILGSEGELTLNGSGGETIVYPITLIEKRKAKEGFPDKHAYVVTQTGLNKKVFTAKAVSTGSEDYILLKFAGRLFGFRVKPADLGDVVVTVEDDE